MKFPANSGAGGEGSDHGWEDPPAGAHVCRCIQIIDLGTQTDTYQGESKRRRKVYFQWELGKTSMTRGEKAGKPFIVGQKYTASMFKNSTLRKMVESWSGKKFAADTARGWKDADAAAEAFDLRKLLGVNGYITIEINDKGYTNIVSLIKRPEEIAAVAPINPQLFFSLDPAEYVEADLAKVGKTWREMILESPEYAKIAGGRPAPEEAKTPGADDDIPF